MTEQEIKRNLLIANSAYSTHGDVSLDEWLKVQDMKRNDPVLSKRYRALQNRK